MTQPKNTQSVLVIGAGLSGLTAANSLHKNGIDVTVLEARDRLGGRLWTVDGVDMGGQWIHGTEGNPITNYARQNQIPAIFVGGDTSYIGGFEQMEIRLPNSEIMTQEEKWKSILIWDQVQDELDNMRRRKISNNEVDISIQEAIDQILQKIPNLGEKEKNYVQWHVNALARDDFASSPDSLSLKYWDEGYEVFGQGDSILIGGYKGIIDKLAENLNIKLNCKVTEIHYNKTGNNCIEVITDNGVYYSNIIIVTLPLGVLKTNNVKFIPPLPPKKIEAIQNLGVGNLSKIVLFFEHVFWPKDQYVFGYIPSALKDTPTQIVNLIPTNKVNALVLVIGGFEGKKIEAYSDEDALKYSITILKDIFQIEIPNPSKMFRTKWSSDPFSCGAYSCMKIGSLPSQIADLELPIDDKVYFAGEATARQFWATTHAAHISGLKVAAKILEKPSLLPSENFTENKRWRQMMNRVSRFVAMKSSADDQGQNKSSYISTLNKIDIFASVPENEIESLAYMLEEFQLQDNEVLCKKGDLATEVYIIHKGEICIELEDNKRILKAAPNVIGEYGLFMKEKNRTATLRSNGSCTILKLDYHRFQRFLIVYPESMFQLMTYSIQSLIQ